jgi:hypothetical protein
MPIYGESHYGGKVRRRARVSPERQILIWQRLEDLKKATPIPGTVRPPIGKAPGVPSKGSIGPLIARKLPPKYRKRRLHV